MKKDINYMNKLINTFQYKLVFLLLSSNYDTKAFSFDLTPLIQYQSNDQIG